MLTKEKFCIMILSMKILSMKYVTFIAAAMLATTLFAASVAASQPAYAQTSETGTVGFTHRLIPPSATEARFAAGQTKTFDVSAWFTTRASAPLGVRLLCPTISAPSPTSKFSLITKWSSITSDCNYAFHAKSTSTSGTEAINVIATSITTNLLGLPVRQTRTVAVTFTFGPESKISVNTPTQAKVQMASNGSVTVDASQYATDGPYTISCGDALVITTAWIASVNRNGCNFTVTGTAARFYGEDNEIGSFSVPYTSSGGDSASGDIPIKIGPPSNITFTSAPRVTQIGRSRSRVVDVLSYARDPIYPLFCGTASVVPPVLPGTSALVSISSQTGCEITFTAGGTRGQTAFTVPFTSKGGVTSTGTFDIHVINLSKIDFTAPPVLDNSLDAGGFKGIDAASYASDGPHTVSCGEATDIGSGLSSVTRADAANSPCYYTIAAASTITTATTASFTVPYTSSGGDTLNGRITVMIEPAPPANAPTNAHELRVYCAGDDTTGFSCY